MKFHIYKDKKGEWRWSLHARNGKKIGDSSEGYKRKDVIWKQINKIQGDMPFARVIED